MSPYLYGGRKAVSPVRHTPTGPSRPRGVVCDGRIVKLFVGQAYGFIRLGDQRDVFFHRADVCDGLSINDFAVGDFVTFELLDDSVSGARALQVRRRRRHR
jgi:cold shock CspA family protein